jgi:putative ABC transport system permease protein
MVPIRYNLRNLAVRRATTFAAAAGVGLVVFVLAAALMLSEGLRRTLDRSGEADHAIVLRKGSDAELPSSIEDSTVSLIRSMPGIAKASDGTPMVIGEVVSVLFMDLEGGGKSNVQLRGVPDDATKFHADVKIVEGTLPKPGSDEAMIGKRVRGRFKGMDLGGSVELRKNRNVRIVGVFEADGSSFESEVWGDLEYVRQALGRPGSVSSVRVKLESKDTFEAFETAVELDKRIGLDTMRELDFYAKQSENTSIFITAMGAVIAVFFSVGAMIGAMITMYGAVSHRRREIGVLRAIGFSRTAIMFSFLLESVLLTLLGGVLGMLGALAMGMVKFSMMNFQTFSEIVFEFRATPEILLTALVFGGFMGVLGGFLPAVQAARTKAIEAMRG